MKPKSKLICIIVAISTVFIFIMLILITKPVSKVKLIASDGENFDSFGGSVSISNNYAIVGSYFDDDKSVASGSAYVFKKDQENANRWIEVKKITASDGDEFDSFGLPVDIEGDYAVVGAWLGGKPKADGAYILKKDHGGKDNWGEIKKLTASDDASDENFGSSVSIHHNYVIVGNPLDNDKGKSSGSAYIFKKDHGGKDNWGEIKKLTASDGGNYNYFGKSVSIYGNYIIVGASSNSSDGVPGSAYIFKKNKGGADNWVQVKKLTADERVTGDYYGKSVSMSGDYAIVGALNDNGEDSGAVYIYRFK